MDSTIFYNIYIRYFCVGDYTVKQKIRTVFSKENADTIKNWLIGCEDVVGIDITDGTTGEIVDSYSNE